MSESERSRVLDKIRAAIQVESLNPPASESVIEDAERRLGVAFPEWLRTIYRSCNGFCGPTGVGYLYPLEGGTGTVALTLFLREEEWSPPWLKRAIIFADNGAGGSITTHWAALDGKLTEWCYGDGAEFTALECDLFEVWKQEQEKWDSLDEE